MGGAGFLALSMINTRIPWRMGLFYQSLIGAAALTAVEFVFGFIFNILFDYGLWNYSHIGLHIGQIFIPLNLLAQICLPYSILWIPLSAFGIFLDDFLRWRIYEEQVPTYTLFKVIAKQ